MLVLNGVAVEGSTVHDCVSFYRVALLTTMEMTRTL